MGEVESEEGITGFEAGHKDGHVSLCAGVWLDVDIGSSVELFESCACEFLDLVHDFASAVVTVRWIALGVLVGKYGSHGLEYLFADEILGGDEFDASHLAFALLLYELEHLCLCLHKMSFF